MDIAYPWPHFWGSCSVITRGWAGRRSRPRRGRTCPRSSVCGGGCAAVRRGASLGIPRWSRILRMTSGFVIAARIFMCPWHLGHFSASIRNTRLRRRAQGSRLPLGILVISMSRDSPSPALPAPAASALAASAAGGAGGVGTTLARSLAAGPRMPCYAERSIMRSSTVPKSRGSRVLRTGPSLTPHNIKPTSPRSGGQRCLAGHQRCDETVRRPEAPGA